MKSNVATDEIAQPYAQALMSVAQSKNQTEQIGEDIRSLLSLLSGSHELQNFLDNPFIQPENKKAVIDQILSGSANTYLRNFLRLLVDRRRISLVETIGRQYLALLRQLNQTVLAEVISAIPLTDAQQQAVTTEVIAMTNARSVELDLKIDREIIGGVIIKVGSQVIDASLRGQLRRISLRLNA